MRNLAVKVPTDLWPEFKARVTACYQAPSRAIARDLAAGTWDAAFGHLRRQPVFDGSLRLIVGR